jgi:transformation/transcription domain-associated protein
MNILRVENEDNAVVCVKIIIDLHRSFRQVLEDQVQPFLDIVQEIFQNMEQTVKDAFDNLDQITTVNINYAFPCLIEVIILI